MVKTDPNFQILINHYKRLVHLREDLTAVRRARDVVAIHFRTMYHKTARQRGLSESLESDGKPIIGVQ